MNPSGLEPSIFQHLKQCFNQLHYLVSPEFTKQTVKNRLTNIAVCLCSHSESSFESNLLKKKVKLSP
jgi:hypothetical protein